MMSGCADLGEALTNKYFKDLAHVALHRTRNLVDGTTCILAQGPFTLVVPLVA